MRVLTQDELVFVSGGWDEMNDQFRPPFEDPFADVMPELFGWRERLRDALTRMGEILDEWFSSVDNREHEHRMMTSCLEAGGSWVGPNSSLTVSGGPRQGTVTATGRSGSCVR